jgi:pSer/pThr/pTyr-binding forkhead associated (FHA) protein
VPKPSTGPLQTTAEVSLVSLDGPEEGSSTPLLQGELTFGRTAPSDVLIDSRLVSKLHARVRRTGAKLVVDDLKSPNGTFVNGARVLTSQSVRDGDVISIAGIRQYRVSIVPAVRPSTEKTLVRSRHASVVLEGPGGKFLLSPGKNAIGRDKDLAVFIDDPQVSRAHAIITVTGLRVTLADDDSVNGTAVNGELVKSAKTLRSGDKIRFGDLEFTVTITAT